MKNETGLNCLRWPQEFNKKNVFRDKQFPFRFLKKTHALNNLLSGETYINLGHLCTEGITHVLG